MTFIVCEVGSNYESLQDCLDSIKVAKECGASAVKFQMYTHKELYGYDGPPMAGELPRDWIPILYEKSQEIGIEFMCTAFSPEGYRFIDPYVKRHKIASAENTDLDILRVVAELGKPILMSTGGSSLFEIKSSLEHLNKCGFNGDLTLMYCVSAYPSKNVDAELAVSSLAVELGVGFKYGYSCHTNEIMTAVYSSRVADVIEKHFKIRDMNTPDNDHSVLPDEFRKMVRIIKEDDEVLFPDPQEADFIKYSKRRWIPELNGYYRTKKP